MFLYIISLWPSGTQSTLDKVMACCLTAPSHYQNQFWLVIKVVLCHLPENSNHNQQPPKATIICIQPPPSPLLLLLSPPSSPPPAGIILWMRPASEWRYIVTSSLIGWVHIQNDPGQGVSRHSSAWSGKHAASEHCYLKKKKLFIFYFCHFTIFICHNRTWRIWQCPLAQM